MRVLARLLVALTLVGLSSAPAAEAHGPCGCLDPRVLEAGGRVRITGGPGADLAGLPNLPAYKVILNPRPNQLGIAPDYLTSAYRADAPSVVVLSRSRRAPTRRARFRIPPDTPPGLYMVLVFDGGEGGAHNTWDYLHVIDQGGSGHPGVVAAPPRARETRSAGARPPAVGSVDGRGLDLGRWAAGAGLIAVACWGAFRVMRGRRGARGHASGPEG